MPELSYGTIFLPYGAEKAVSTTKGHPLGTRAITMDGRVFRYALANGAIGAGELVETNAQDAGNAKDLAITSATPVGNKGMRLTVGSAAVNADTFADGYVFINSGALAGLGLLLRLSTSHASVASVGTFVISFADGETIREALTTSALAGLRKNTYLDVAQGSSVAQGSRTKPIIGVAPVEVADNEFFWLQTWGECAALYTSTIAGVASRPVMPSTVAGAFTGVTVATATVGTTVPQVIGFLGENLASTTDDTVIFLTLSP